MTRINLVPPEELMDQHLFAEFREIKMVPKALRRSVVAAQRKYGALWGSRLKAEIPDRYVLGTGHVRFFYDKGAYLQNRYEAIKAELRKRGINFNEASPPDPDSMYRDYPTFCGNYTPTTEDLRTIRERIAERISLKPDWYRYSGQARF